MATDSDYTTREVEYKSLDFMGYPNYRVGDDGSVWNCARDPWREMSQSNCRGYKTVIFSQDGIPANFYVHRLVLLAFRGLCPENMESCHNDGNKHNNHLENLRWDTKKSNQGDRTKHGTSNRGERNAAAKITEDDVREIRRLHSTGTHTETELQKRFRLSKAQINKIINRKVWKTVE